MSPAAQRIALFDNRLSFRAEWPRLADAIGGVFESDKFSHGPVTRRFETEMARHAGAAFAIGVNSGTDALRIVLRACGVARGDEVILPAFAPAATAAAVWLIGARPIFVDVHPDSLTPTPEAVRAAATDRTRAVVFSGGAARPAEATAVRAEADRAGLAFAEDGADGIAAADAPAIPMNRALPLSAGAVLGGLGDAGVILTDDAAVADRCRLIRHHGRAGECAGRVSEPTAALVSGLNSKMDDIQAAVLLARLPGHTEVTARRAELAARYSVRLARVGPVRPLAASATGRYVVETPERDGLAGFLAERGIETRKPVPVPLHLLDCFAGLGGRPGEHPVSESAATATLELPLYPDLGTSGVDLVCSAVAAFFREGIR
ncbi:DegT/DnrJ/EryC1/StrS family aminotransferase [Catenuloplanes atrovinosus]|uniref:dTDP-4-amino-4,6-dideoxygalactose transaminase n=1 Tax=Catenuloplanes atrovinosus TaxID=137266 RepID=A0AAE3YN69_9ACTN|nr:DegT/DnrJ/EryC1/StrS family aminotransferase [Catenuloplanes atrovinosus]MDR7275582.1 dTDP-4-amino-4,6-dideoxygalactose transaminase [Catenuloplanes atrovinosus]